MSIAPLPEYDEHDQLPLDSGPSSPPYSVNLQANEHAIPAGSISPMPLYRSMTMDSESLWSTAQSHCYCYKNSLISVSLGRRLWGVRQPAYGTQAEVQGTVRLSNKCTHVSQILVTLSGKATISATIRGAASNGTEIRVVNENMILPNPNPDGFYPVDHLYYFSLAFPAKCKESDDPPPPTYSSWFPGMSCEVNYVLKVDVYRKGLRRHEDKRIPLQYLPKSWPSGNPSRNIFSDPEAFKTVRLIQTWPENACHQQTAKADAPVVLVSVPSVKSVPSGYYLPLRVTIHSPAAPALAKLLAGAINIRLTKHTRVMLRGQFFASRERVLATATLLEVDTHAEGHAVVHLVIGTGQAGKERSWAISGIMEAMYLVRILVRAPEGAETYLPVYAHDEVVQIATEPWGTRERELLSLGGASAPALGLLSDRYDMELSTSASSPGHGNLT